MNNKLIEQFNLLIQVITYQMNNESDPKKKITHQFRLKSIKNALSILKKFPDEIKTGEDLKHVHGIGKGIIKRIDEILKTGTMEDIKKYKNKIIPSSNVSEQLEKVIGIGPATARKLVKKYKIMSIDDLRKKFKSGQVPLIHSISLGLKYYEDSLKKIPRVEITKIYHIFKKAVNKIDKNLMVKFAGSYRRKLPTSGDIDVLLTHKKIKTNDDYKQNNINYLKKLVELFSKSFFGVKILDHLTEDITTKYMGFIQYKKKPVRRIDIRFIPQISWFPALLYFTGSRNFNIDIRKKALKKNLTINEYGVYKFKNKKKGKMIPVNSEHDIFKLVDMKYLKPSERNY